MPDRSLSLQRWGLTVSHQNRVAGRAALVLLLGLAAVWAGGAALAQETQTEEESSRATATWRERTDRPVLNFTRGPAGILMTDAEIINFEQLADLPSRAVFIRTFWDSFAWNCPPGDESRRDLFWENAEEASARFNDEGTPGWLTDRGRVYLFAGEPDSKRETEGTLDGIARNLLVWSWEQPGEGFPRNVVFLDDPFGWRIVAVDAEIEPGAAPALALSDAPTLEAITRKLADAFRAEGCEMTPEQMAEAAARQWKRVLWDAGQRLIDAGSVEVAGSVAPIWHFFPAEAGATLTLLTLPLDSGAAAFDRLVAMLRDEQNEEATFYFGGEDFPFETRELDDRSISQAVRALPPGRYKLIVGAMTGDEAPQLLWAGDQVIARVSDDSLRMTSVIVASQLDPTGRSEESGPFSLGGFDIVPHVGNEFRAGDELNVFFQVVGATKNASGAADLAVSYQLFGRPPGRDWVKLGQPNRSSEPGAVRVWTLPITAAFRPAEYKLDIEVVDNVSLAKVSKEVMFRVVTP